MVVVIEPDGRVSTLFYSEKYKAFNVLDSFTKKEAWMWKIKPPKGSIVVPFEALKVPGSEKPLKSGEYVVNNGLIISTEYSEVHGMFNCHDNLPPTYAWSVEKVEWYYPVEDFRELVEREFSECLTRI